MTPIITKLLRYLPLFLFLVQLTDPALALKIKNHAALKPQPPGIYIIHANLLAKPSHYTTTTSRILYTYDKAVPRALVPFHGGSPLIHQHHQPHPVHL
ncbi:unnamed protein product [Urochloa humidicola]